MKQHENLYKAREKHSRWDDLRNSSCPVAKTAVSVAMLAFFFLSQTSQELVDLTEKLRSLHACRAAAPEKDCSRSLQHDLLYNRF